MSGRSDSRSETPRSEKAPEQIDDKQNETTDLMKGMSLSDSLSDPPKDLIASDQPKLPSGIRSGWSDAPVPSGSAVWPQQPPPTTNHQQQQQPQQEQKPWQVHVDQGRSWETDDQNKPVSQQPPNWNQNVGTEPWSTRGPSQNPGGPQWGPPPSHPSQQQSSGPIPSGSWGSLPPQQQPPPQQQQHQMALQQPSGPSSSIGAPCPGLGGPGPGLGGPPGPPLSAPGSNWGAPPLQQQQQPQQQQQQQGPPSWGQPSNQPTSQPPAAAWGGGGDAQSSQQQPPTNWGAPTNPNQPPATPSWSGQPTEPRASSSSWGDSRDRGDGGHSSYGDSRQLKLPDISHLSEEQQKLINNNEGWGKNPISQATKWELAETPETRQRLPSGAIGTEIWDPNKLQCGVSGNAGPAREPVIKPSYMDPPPQRQPPSWPGGPICGPGGPGGGTIGGPGGGGPGNWDQRPGGGNWDPRPVNAPPSSHSVSSGKPPSQLSGPQFESGPPNQSPWGHGGGGVMGRDQSEGMGWMGPNRGRGPQHGGPPWQNPPDKGDWHVKPDNHWNDPQDRYPVGGSGGFGGIPDWDKPDPRDWRGQQRNDGPNRGGHNPMMPSCQHIHNALKYNLLPGSVRSQMQMAGRDILEKIEIGCGRMLQEYYTKENLKQRMGPISSYQQRQQIENIITQHSSSENKLRSEILSLLSPPVGQGHSYGQRQSNPRGPYQPPMHHDHYKPTEQIWAPKPIKDPKHDDGDMTNIGNMNIGLDKKADVAETIPPPFIPGQRWEGAGSMPRELDPSMTISDFNKQSQFQRSNRGTWDDGGSAPYGSVRHIWQNPRPQTWNHQPDNVNQTPWGPHE